jgi:hypothetical protein
MSVSQKPWSDYTKADYTVEQWHNACLIHDHTGAPTSKDQCKLPVKTPNGTLNKNGVFAAAAALAGARGGVNATSAQKNAASKKLVSFYSQVGAKPPPSLKQGMDVSEFLEHHGVKGQKWGIINKSRRKPGLVPSSHEHRTARRLQKKPRSALSNKELTTLNERLTLEQKHRQLNPTKTDIGAKRVKQIMAALGTATTLAAVFHGPLGKLATNLFKKHGVKQLKLF